MKQEALMTRKVWDAVSNNTQILYTEVTGGKLSFVIRTRQFLFFETYYKIDLSPEPGQQFRVLIASSKLEALSVVPRDPVLSALAANHSFDTGLFYRSGLLSAEEPLPR